MTQWTRQEIDFAFIAEFQNASGPLGGAIRLMERREHLRILILKAGKEKSAFHDSQMTYGEAFQLAYGARIDRRAHDRSKPRAPVPIAPRDDEEDDSDDDTAA